MAANGVAPGGRHTHFGGSTLGIGGWISYPAGHVRHKEFRFEPPPERVEAEEHHHHGDESSMAHDEHAEDQPAKPAVQGSMPGMEASKNAAPVQQPMSHDSPVRPGAPTQEQLEASRLQLEASRRQLEASRKQLEAAGGASPFMGPSSNASPPTSPPPHKQDDHPHQP